MNNKLWNLSSKFSKKGGIWKLLGRLFELMNFVIYSNNIYASVKVGDGTYFYHHGLGCVIHGNTVIGKNCKIFQNVTMGSRWSQNVCRGEAPIIGDNVLVGAGAVIMGNVKIGNNASIGANAVVLKDVPDNCLAVGVPAVIRKKD